MNFSFRTFGLFTAALVLFFSVVSSFTVIPPGHVGVVFNRWTGDLTTTGQGLVLKVPFVTTVQEYPVSLRTYTMVQKATEGSSDNDDSLDLPTKEGQHIKQDLSITFNTTPERAADVFKAFNGAEIETIESTFIRRTVITVAQNVAGQMSLTEVISSKRDDLQTSIETHLSKELNKMGFNVDKINLGASHLPHAIEEQMQQKMASQQQAQQAEYELQKQEALARAAVATAKGQAESVLVNARAQAEANNILLKSLSPGLIQYRTIEKWNGAVSIISGASTPMINVDKLLKQ